MKVRNLFIVAAFLMLFSCTEKHANPLIQSLNDSWNVSTDTLGINMQVDVPSVIIADMYEEGLIPHPYYCKLPKDIHERDVIVLDPMLATGGSAVDAIDQIKSKNPRSIKFMCIIAAPEGLNALKEAHPDVDIFVASLDEKLNDHGYIVPGLGDAGDRIFGTK